MNTDEKLPTIRVHIWLETEKGLFFGHGRAQLLSKIEEYGSLKKAAEKLGMSYRAAWGKIRKSEEVLGIPLVVKAGSNKEGYQLTPEGKALKDKFIRWFGEVEKYAAQKAGEIFPWNTKSYTENHK